MRQSHIISCPAFTSPHLIVGFINIMLLRKKKSVKLCTGIQDGQTNSCSLILNHNNSSFSAVDQADLEFVK